MTAPRSPWWTPAIHADRRPRLLARNRLRRAVRDWFEARDFTEVETAALQVSPGNEMGLSAFATTLETPAGGRETLYLHTSPEFAAKKLMAAGERRLVVMGPVWRNGERGALHAPEFTMLEWYRAGERYEQLMRDGADLLRLAAETAGTTRFRFRNREADPYLEPERVTVAEGFHRFAGIDLLATLSPDGTETDREDLGAQVRAAGIRTAPDDTWGDLFTRVLVERVEPGIGEGRAAILHEYPAPEAALARRKAGDPRVSERFELFCCGVELANCFGELTDPAEQRRRFESEMSERERRFGSRYPVDEDFLAALAHMPQTSGAALGFDRLAMLAVGAERVEDVIWTPVPGGDW